MIDSSTPARPTAWTDAERPMRRIGHAIESRASVGSTNDRARDLLAAPGGDGWVVVAEEQTAGRGRRGRTWISPPGRNLTLSIALRPRLAARDAWQLGLAAALATAGACGTVATVRLKWPNDLVTADGRKLGGLLIETTVEGDRLSGAVIGVGINVNWSASEMPDEIRASSSSLADEAGAPVDRVELLGRLLDAMDEEVHGIEAGRSPLARYRGLCATLGTTVAVATVDGVIHGRAVDLDAAGGLIVDAADGRHVLASGEVVRLRPGDAA